MSEVGQWPWAPLQQDEPQDEWEDYKPWIPALFVPEQVIINVNQVAEAMEPQFPCLQSGSNLDSDLRGYWVRCISSTWHTGNTQ